MSSRLDTLWPPCGPCAFCGASDKRHRLWDAILGRDEAGETVDAIADDYDVPSAVVVAVIQDYPGSDLYREIHHS